MLLARAIRAMLRSITKPSLTKFPNIFAQPRKRISGNGSFWRMIDTGTMCCTQHYRFACYSKNFLHPTHKMFYPTTVTPYTYLSGRNDNVEPEDGLSSSFDSDNSSPSLWLELSASSSISSAQDDAKILPPIPNDFMRPAMPLTATSPRHRPNRVSGSNFLFFVGACCNTIVAVWDLTSDKKATANGTYFSYAYRDEMTGDGYQYYFANDDDGLDDDDGTAWNSAFANSTNIVDDDSNKKTASDDLFYFLYTFGPVVYLGVALLEIRQALWSISSDTTSAKRLSSLWWRLAAALVFGLGAMCEIYSTVLDDVFETEDSWVDDAYHLQVAAERPWFASNYKLNAMSVHLYLVSGLLRFVSFLKASSKATNSRLQYAFPDNDISWRNWILLGAAQVFVVATLFDCILSYIYDPQTWRDAANVSHDYLFLDKVDTASTILWNVAAVLYILADLMKPQPRTMSAQTVTVTLPPYPVEEAVPFVDGNPAV